MVNKSNFINITSIYFCSIQKARQLEGETGILLIKENEIQIVNTFLLEILSNFPEDINETKD